MTAEVLSVDRLLSRIKSRGYWRVVIRPAATGEQRIATLEECWRIVESAQVNLRGYLDYPHVPNRRIERENWVEGGAEFLNALEVWRFDQNGQFLHHFFVSEDWLLGIDSPQTPEAKELAYRAGDRTLNVYNALYTCTEILQFASRLVHRDVLSSVGHIRIELHHTDGRRLTAPKDEPSLDHYVAHQDVIVWEVTTLALHILAAAPDLALDAALGIFGKFGWQPRRSVLQHEQGRILRRRP